MATRSSIAVVLATGKIKAVYCHWDGYIEHNGAILQAHYNSQELAEKLISNGSISSLDKNCDGGSSHTFDNPNPGQTVYYGRDRGEDEAYAKEFETVAAWQEWASESNAEYMYLFKNGRWEVTSYDKHTSTLADALAENNEEEEE